jgi:hypothetical protein
MRRFGAGEFEMSGGNEGIKYEFEENHKEEWERISSQEFLKILSPPFETEPSEGMWSTYVTLSG